MAPSKLSPHTGQFPSYTYLAYCSSGGSRISRWGGGVLTHWRGANLRHVHFSAKTYAKTKEIDPVGGGGHVPAAPPLDPPICSMTAKFTFRDL